MNSNFFSPLPRYDDGEEGNSQSLSQVHPRCAIRLDTQPYLGSQSHPNSLTRSSPTPFAMRDVNAVHTSCTASAKALSRTHESPSEAECASQLTHPITNDTSAPAHHAETVSHYTHPTTSSLPHPSHPSYTHSSDGGDEQDDNDEDEDDDDEIETSTMTATRTAALQPVMPEEHTVLQYLPESITEERDGDHVIGEAGIASQASRLASPEPRVIAVEETVTAAAAAEVSVHDAQANMNEEPEAPLPLAQAEGKHSKGAHALPSRSATSHSPPRRRTFILSRVPSELGEDDGTGERAGVQERQASSVRRSFTNDAPREDRGSNSSMAHEANNDEDANKERQTTAKKEEDEAAMHAADEAKTPLKMDARGSIILDFSPVTETKTTAGDVSKPHIAPHTLLAHAAHEPRREPGRLVEEKESEAAVRGRSASSASSAQDSLLSPLPRPVWPTQQLEEQEAAAAEDVLMHFRTTSELQQEEQEEDMAKLPFSSSAAAAAVHAMAAHVHDGTAHETHSVHDHTLPDSMLLVKGRTPSPLQRKRHDDDDDAAARDKHSDDEAMRLALSEWPREASTGLDTPSARVSSEVRQLVERAQEEVRRTRESLLATLRFSAATSATGTGTGAENEEEEEDSGAEKAAMNAATTTNTAGEDTLTPPLILHASSTPYNNMSTITSKACAAAQAEASTAATITHTVPHALKESGGHGLSTTPAAVTRLSWCDEAQLLRKSISEMEKAAELRPQLRACAGGVARRLRGYDAEETSVLPMETVLRVVQFVLQQQQQQQEQEQKADKVRRTDNRQPESGMGATLWSTQKDQATVLQAQGPGVAVSALRHNAVEEEEEEERSARLLLTSTPCRPTTDSALCSNITMNISPLSPARLPLTPQAHPASLAMRRSAQCSPLQSSAARLSTRMSTNLLTAASDSPLWLNIAGARHAMRHDAQEAHQSHKRSRSASDEEQEKEKKETNDSSLHATADTKKKREVRSCSHGGRPATCISPTRTLEYVMARQAARAAEADLLSLYCTILRLFREVYGERYAWHHLGATEATKQDGTRARHEEQLHESKAASHRSAAANDGSSISAPLETMFPRLRQQYGATLQVGNSATTSTLSGNGAAATRWPVSTGSAPDILRYPPPLDMLIYYPVFVESLREL